MTRVRFVVLVAGALLLAACSTNRDITTILPTAEAIGTQQTVFGATTRQAEGETFGFNRSTRLSLMELEISVPPNHVNGTLRAGGLDPDPERDFVLTSQTLHSEQNFRRQLAQSLNSVPAFQREVTVFVHGFNNTHVEAAFRTAQLKHDIDIPGTMIFYSWPSRGAPLGYAYDEDSALFARDGLERLLNITRETTGRPVILVAHSLGTQLTMETLRQIEIRSPGWTGRNLSGVVLMSPDLDVDVFRTQLSRFQSVPEPFLIFSNQRDRALGLSQLLRGAHTRARLGNISSLDRLSDLSVQVIDTSDLKRSRDLNHFPAANSPASIAMLRRLRQEADAQQERSIDLVRLIPGSVSQADGAVRVKLEETPPPRQ